MMNMNICRLTGKISYPQLLETVKVVSTGMGLLQPRFHWPTHKEWRCRWVEICSLPIPTISESGRSGCVASLQLQSMKIDSDNQVDSAGMMSTYAGSDSFGFGGDGGPASSARLYYPVAVAVNSWGDLYINDHVNFRIRMVRLCSFLFSFPFGWISRLVIDKLICLMVGASRSHHRG